MADFLNDLLGSEMSFLFVISSVVWIGIIIYMFYLKNKLDEFSKELVSLTDD